jgi:hemoglobin/transferrin/lactoferrin receptor protein
MKKFLIIILSFLFVQNIVAQKNKTVLPDTLTSKTDLEEVVISSGNFVEKRKNVAQKIDVIAAKTIAKANAQNTGDLLASTGKIFVQKSQQGGSSPVIRGFEASRILIVVDGVRMNNAIYRAGHLQNVITMDQNSLARVEVMYGPSSTTYGSDALGGIIHLITKSPLLSADKKKLLTGTAFSRYSTVNNEKTIHADVSIGVKKLAWFQSYNYSNFGDMKMGNNYRDKYPDFGRRSFYIDRINGVDTILKNNDDRVQKFSGYKQWDIIQKFLIKPTPNSSHLFNFQLSNSTNVPRYDRLQDTRNFGGTIGTALRFAEWYYGPQTRLLGAYEFNFRKKLFFDEVKANVNYQYVKESRQTREYKRYDRFESQVEKVNVFGVTISGRKIIGDHEFILGTDAQLNDVKSVALRTNLTNSSTSKILTRYPEGKFSMNSFGIYMQHTYKFTSKKFVLNDGIRLQFVNLKSNVIDNSFLRLPDTAVSQNNVAVTGNIGFVYRPTNTTTLKTAVSSAFRAPNIDDLSKVFESSTAARQVVVPNASLKPEFTYNVDVEISQVIAKAVKVELTGFYSIFNNAIITAPFLLNGQDSVIFNGVQSQVLASQNVNRANVYGFNFALDATFLKNFYVRTSVGFTKGRYKTDVTVPSTIYEKQVNGFYALVKRNVSTKPLDHIPPAIGKTSIGFQKNKISTELHFLYNGWKYLNDYNADGEDNAQYATADGMPAWMTVNIKVQLEINKNVQMQIGLENIFDRNYRYFASGFSAGGRNFYTTARLNF